MGGWVPYKDSKLTWILKESLGGNSKTTIIICASPAQFNELETKGTLEFGKRAKTIKNVVGINEELTADEWKKRFEAERSKCRALTRQNSELKEELERWRGGETVAEEDQVSFDCISEEPERDSLPKASSRDSIAPYAEPNASPVTVINQLRKEENMELEAEIKKHRAGVEVPEEEQIVNLYSEPLLPVAELDEGPDSADPESEETRRKQDEEINRNTKLREECFKWREGETVPVEEQIEIVERPPEEKIKIQEPTFEATEGNRGKRPKKKKVQIRTPKRSPKSPRRRDGDDGVNRSSMLL